VHAAIASAPALDLPVVREVQSVREGKVKVLHAPAEIAGQASVLARALRELGVEAHSLAYNPGFPQYTPDEARGYDDWPAAPRYLGYLASLLRHAGRYDVYHFHFGRTLIPPHNLDLPLYQALGARVVFHYHGCDVRNRRHMLAHHARATCTECDPFCVPARQQRILASAARYADAELVSTPDLLESATRATHLPVAARLEDYPPRPSDGTPALVLHAPTNRLIKGTRYVEAAFGALRPRFPGVTFETVERLPWRELRERLERADVVVDQLFMGWYGMVAVEAMAMAKPALCFIREDFEPRLDRCPIVRCDAHTLADRLAELLEDGARRRQLGLAGRDYVEREHAAPRIARRLVELYESLAGAPRHA
jgi:glycosyltransferase involved in cell wall biosynthesis